MENRSYEIVDGRYEPKVGVNMAEAITHAVEDVPADTVASFGLDATRCVPFTSNDRPRDVWDALMEKMRNM